MRNSIILLIACLAFTQAAKLRAQSECFGADCMVQGATLQQPVVTRIVPTQPSYIESNVVNTDVDFCQTCQVAAPVTLARPVRLVKPVVLRPPRRIVAAPKVVTTGHKVASQSAVNKNNYVKDAPHNYYVDARRTNYIDARRNNLVSNKDGDDINVYDASKKRGGSTQTHSGGDGSDGSDGLFDLLGSPANLQAAAAADADQALGATSPTMATGDSPYVDDKSSVRSIGVDVMNP